MTKQRETSGLRFVPYRSVTGEQRLSTIADLPRSGRLTGDSCRSSLREDAVWAPACLSYPSKYELSRLHCLIDTGFKWSDAEKASAVTRTLSSSGFCYDSAPSSSGQKSTIIISSLKERHTNGHACCCFTLRGTDWWHVWVIQVNLWTVQREESVWTWTDVQFIFYSGCLCATLDSASWSGSRNQEGFQCLSGENQRCFTRNKLR